jgi:sugar lactone lactonase YvrE
MNFTRTCWSRWALAANVLAAGLVLFAADRITEITLAAKELYPESITSLKDGTLMVGSLGHGSVLRIPPGRMAPEIFVPPGKDGLASVLGVLADEKSNTLWVCSNNLDGKGAGPTALKAFDLKTGAPKGAYPLPGQNALCNDIAVSEEGTAYITDTRLNSVLMLKRGAKELEVAAKDEKLAGADGLAFGEKNALYVNSVTANQLLRLDLGKDGKAQKITELALSRALDRPDGMRTISKDRLLLAENAGRMDIVKIEKGDKATITPIKEGLEATPGVTLTQGMAWVVEGKLNYRNDPKLKGKDPGTFGLYAVPLPK